MRCVLRVVLSKILWHYIEHYLWQQYNNNLVFMMCPLGKRLGVRCGYRPSFWLCLGLSQGSNVVPTKGTPILGHGREVPQWWTPFWGGGGKGVQSDWIPILYLNTIQLTPFFCRKNWFVSITFSSRDTTGMRKSSWSAIYS